MGPLPVIEDHDTDPELFKRSPEDTKKFCVFCGSSPPGSFDDGVTHTVRELRKWLATRMTASEAIAVTSAFVRTCWPWK